MVAVLRQLQADDRVYLPETGPHNGQDERTGWSQGWRMGKTERAILTKVIDRLLPKAHFLMPKFILFTVKNDISRSFGLLILPLDCV
jgi:hypothetical protein